MALDEAARPAGGYIWDKAAEKGVSYRSYGEWVANGKTSADPATASTKAIEGHFDPGFRSFDMDYPDVKRTDRFLDELSQVEQNAVVFGLLRQLLQVDDRAANPFTADFTFLELPRKALRTPHRRP